MTLEEYCTAVGNFTKQLDGYSPENAAAFLANLAIDFANNDPQEAHHILAHSLWIIAEIKSHVDRGAVQ